MIQVRLLTIDNLGHSGTENVIKTLFHKEEFVCCEQEAHDHAVLFQNEKANCIHSGPLLFNLSR